MKRFLLPILFTITLLPSAASAHKVWLLPSQTTFSGNDPWVTVDAAVSNDIFYFNHFPLRLDNLEIIAPDRSSAEAQNQSVGKYRSVFDLPLSQRGTYRIALVNRGVFASYELGGERKRWRGKPADLANEIPAEATNLRVTESIGRIETFVTNGPPTADALKQTGEGVELLPVTHPNDLYAGEESTFRLVVNGKPLEKSEVTIIRGGTRYRNSQAEMQITTDANGEFRVKWPEAGMYWIETSGEDKQTSVPQAQVRRLSYAATLEVLPQ